MNPIEEKQRAEWRERTYRELVAELRQNEYIQKLVEGYHPMCLQNIIDDYAQKKLYWMEWGEQSKDWVRHVDEEWIEDAHARLEEIQQKKLFDLQCRWRAETITLPKIRVSDDFEKWSKNILNCPFLSPITPEEMAMYEQYIRSNNFEERTFKEDWQNYDEIKEAYQDENSYCEVPEWYDFHNSCTGASTFLLLPDIRGQKEGFYITLVRESDKRLIEQKSKTVSTPQAPAETRPFLKYHENNFLAWFVKTFDDAETQELFSKSWDNIYKNNNDDDGEWEDWETMVTELNSAEKPFPMQPWHDWRDALRRTHLEFKKEMLLLAMPIAYEQYLTTIELGLGFAQPDEDPFEDNWYADMILEGRVLNKEPKNFKF